VALAIRVARAPPLVQHLVKAALHSLADPANIAFMLLLALVWRLAG
jgi:hypothetical protein